MKKRLDVYLVEKGYFDTREKAKREILVGNVFVNDQKVTKAGEQIKEENIKEIRIKDKLPYVSRGGLKLKGAIDKFNINFNDLVVLDIGASTGGFTDCALKHGASLVYAVDVGTNQLAYELQQNNRVISYEKTHIKDLREDQIKQKVDMVVIDVSFISLTKIFDEIKRLENSIFNDDYKVVALIKPQFELTKDHIGKNGIVEKQEYRDMAIKKIVDKVKFDYEIIGIETSPIHGTKGNIEYLMYLKVGGK